MPPKMPPVALGASSLLGDPEEDMKVPPLPPKYVF